MTDTGRPAGHSPIGTLGDIPAIGMQTARRYALSPPSKPAHQAATWTVADSRCMHDIGGPNQDRMLLQDSLPKTACTAWRAP